MIDKKSLFGPKPTICPAPFEACGDCNIYPCLVGQPSVSLGDVQPHTYEVGKKPGDYVLGSVIRGKGDDAEDTG